MPVKTAPRGRRGDPVSRVNRWAAPCALCGGRVPANGGNLTRTLAGWAAVHLACAEAGGPAVDTSTDSHGRVSSRNRRGTCEDAPCCGCCY